MSAVPDIEIPATEWSEDLDLLATQTQRLADTIASFDDTAVSAPSGLPGWTRGHVLAHLDGNAQGLGRLARWAADRVERPMYISREVRDADVALHAPRNARDHERAVVQSAHALQEDLRRLSAEQRAGEVVLGNGLVVQASSLARHRLQEVTVHHADLGLPGYTWRDWPTPMATHMIRLVARDFAERGEFPVAGIGFDGARVDIVAGDSLIEGTPQAILAWMLGRSDGEGLAVSGIDAIPAAPTWR